MTIAYITHPSFNPHQMGDVHPESQARLSEIEGQSIETRFEFALRYTMRRPQRTVNSSSVCMVRPASSVSSCSHRQYVMAGLNLTEHDYARITREIKAIADR